jgi:hypothetical protein
LTAQSIRVTGIYGFKGFGAFFCHFVTLSLWSLCHFVAPVAPSHRNAEETPFGGTGQVARRSADAFVRERVQVWQRASHFSSDWAPQGRINSILYQWFNWLTVNRAVFR